MLAKYRALREDHAAVSAAGRDPFGVAFDTVLSATEATLDGRRVLLLGTNNYLGLTFDRDCVAAAVAATEAEGTGTTGSRIANGSYGGHEALEKRLARFLRRRGAMVFSTGYQANLGTLAGLAGRGDHLLLDADSHASIYDGARLAGAQVTRFRHNDPDDLRRRLRVLSSQPGDKLVVVEGIYSMLGDTAPLREIAAVKREAGAWLLVDEAHSLGVLGAEGRGLAEAEGVEAEVDFVVGTFSKSLGAVGGFCASDLPDFDVLRIASRPYMFTASLPPSVVASVARGIDAMDARPELRARLAENGRALHAGLAAAGFALGAGPGPIVSLRMPDRETAIRFWNLLLAEGVYTNLAVGTATPGGKPLLRMSVSAALTAEQLAFAVAAIGRVGAALGARGDNDTAAAAVAAAE
ncbi:pyridoxal phosphate-dependent aminotransferase family protein [Craurococcus roseus]|uniref:Pyridoxal phosphate-dependent aminotransferase family protein n=1 Tax=Craurococcus roseus TaxID=77585 RepID=A0ABN1G5Q0_9PROT